jgi:hypothetical protein
MAIELQDQDGTIQRVDSSFRAARMSRRPLDHGLLGQYRLSTIIALVVTQAANGTLFSFRWGNASNLCVLQKLRLQCLQTAAATATIMPSFQAFIARGFTASDSVGTALTPTGNASKKRTSMGTSLVTDIRKSAVAAGLTVGTRTLDADPFLELMTNQTITTPNDALYAVEMDAESEGEVHPYVLATNEGFIIRGPTVVFGAAGTANLAVDLAWAELAAY